MSLKIAYIATFFIHCFYYSSGFSPDKNDTYSTEKRLFHIERSKNKNIVCYDINVSSTGVLNEKKPLSVYWINLEEQGQQEELSFIQEKLAYGYTVGKQNGTVSIELNATKNRKITVEHNGQRYFCRIEINHRPSVLQKIYVKTKPNNSLQVEYVELHGLDLATGAPVTERFFP